MPPNTSQYTTDQKLEACALYAIHGKAKRVSELTGIPENTITHWKNHSDWWEHHIVSIRAQTRDYTLSRIEKAIEKAFDKTDEALELGDVVKVDWDRDTGEEKAIRAPVKGKDAATIAAIMIDKRQILLNQPTSIRGDAAGGMADLLKQFKDLAAQNSRDERVVDEQ